MPAYPTVHMMYGFVGAGKTTFAKRLETKIRAVRFTHDEWMTRFYGTTPAVESFEDYANRVNEQIWAVAERLLHLGQDVILDFGFWKRNARDAARARAARCGAVARLYFISCPDALMKSRVLNRTKALPPGEFWIDAAAFEQFKSRFEPLGPDEEHVLIQSDNLNPET